MALNSLGLGFVFTARDLASGTIGRVSREFGGLDRAALAAQQSYQRNVAVMGAGFATLAAGVGTLMGGFALAGQASSFEEEIAAIGQITRASTTELQQLHDAAIDAGLATRFSPQEAAQGLSALGQAGFTASESMNLLESSLDFAAGGRIGIESATSAVAAAVRVFGLEGERATLVADQFLRITNSTMLAAGDMELAMGTVARGAGLTRQSIEEMLPSIGLVRNTGVDVSVAASSVSSALVFMSQRADAFRNLGVAITDANGQFRPFLDIVTETQVALEERFPDAADRAAEATDLFSRFGITAYNAITTQLASGVRTASGEILRGADAVNYLRNEMGNARGTAAEFRDAMLDTFGGQVTILQGAMQTLGVTLGEGFTNGLKPVVKYVADTVSAIAGFINGIPVEVRGAIAQAIMFFGFLTAALGAVVTSGAAIALIAPFFVAIVEATGALLIAMSPLVALFGALYAGVAVFRYLQQTHNGFAISVSENLRALRLGFNGLVQLFTTGELRGALAEELLKPANEGILTFITRIYQIGFRVVQFFRGVGIGFSAGMAVAAPAVDRMLAAFRRLGQALGIVADDGAKAAASVPSARFADMGARVGDFLASMVETTVEVITHVADFTRGFVSGVQTMWRIGGPIFNVLGVALADVGRRILDLAQRLGIWTDTTKEGSSGVEMFGQVVGVVFGGVAWIVGGALAVIIGAIDIVIAAFQLWGDAMRNAEITGYVMGANLVRVFYGIRDSFLNMVDSSIGSAGRLMAAIPAPLRPQGAESIIAAGAGAEARIAGRASEAAARQGAMTRGLAELSASPAVAQQGADAERAASQQIALARVADLIDAQRRERDGKTQTTIVQVDGETIARVVNRASRNAAASEFQQIATNRGNE